MLDLTHLPEYLTVPEIAGHFRVSPSTVYRWIQEGRLAALRLGHRQCYRVERGALAAFIQTAADF